MTDAGISRQIQDPASMSRSWRTRKRHARFIVGIRASVCLLGALAMAAAVLAVLSSQPVAAGAATSPTSGPFRPYFAPPFAKSCTVHKFGEGQAPPLTGIPDDPLCVEYTKRDITITDGGAIKFLAAEPARFLVALPKCGYWQQDHWSVQFAPGQLAVIRWDGSYWFDKGTGQAGARLHNLRIGGVPVGTAQLARLVAPYSPTLAHYFRSYSHGGSGLGYAGSIPFDPRCAK